jgi:lipid-binding SYLF domain-containing protein
MRSNNKPVLASAFVALALLLGLALSGPAFARDPVVEARQTLALFTKTDPGIRKFIESSVGYAVFPSIVKGGLAVGGARGEGVLFSRDGTPLGKATVTQVTVGLQAGGQSFSEIIFFENPKVMGDFKGGNFAMAAQVSAVALANGAAQSARYNNGVAVFTATNSGLMFEASIGGQKFSVKPLGQ